MAERGPLVKGDVWPAFWPQRKTEQSVIKPLNEIEALARGDKMMPQRKEAAFTLTERILTALQKALGVKHDDGKWFRCMLDRSDDTALDGRGFAQECRGAVELRMSKTGGQIALNKDNVESRTYLYVGGHPVLLNLVITNRTKGDGWGACFVEHKTPDGAWMYVFPKTAVDMSVQPTDDELAALGSALGDALDKAVKPISVEASQARDLIKLLRFLKK
jgi:hypothetical protein